MNTHLTICWSAKGGQGTTVTAALLALAWEQQCAGVELIDHPGGDLAAALGVSIATADMRPPKHAVTFAAMVTPRIRLLNLDVDHPRSTGALARRIDQAHEEDRHVIIDAGHIARWAPRGNLRFLDRLATRSYLVIRPCYLALHRAVAVGRTPTGIIVVREAGRALRANDIVDAIGAPIVAELGADPAIARGVDAGLLAARGPFNPGIRQLRHLIAARHDLATPVS